MHVARTVATALSLLVCTSLAHAQPPAQPPAPAPAQPPAPAPAPAQPPTPHKEDTLDPLRERFRAGMERYRAGAFADAIVIWEAIYRELGAEKGYRLAFNIARAYDRRAETPVSAAEQVADITRAAEHFEAYLKETKIRHEAGETLEPLVIKQEAEATARLAELAATKGRIRVKSDRTIAVKIDAGQERLAGAADSFVVYVAPGKHDVIFNPGTKEEHRFEITIDVGEQREISPPPRKIEPPPPPIRYETHEERPYSKVVLYVAAGVTVVSVIVPVIFYSNAWSLHDEYYGTPLKSERQVPDFGGREHLRNVEGDYKSAVSTAYASIAVPATLGALTLGLAAYWFFGTKEVRVPIQGGLVPGGSVVGATTRF